MKRNGATIFFFFFTRREEGEQMSPDIRAEIARKKDILPRIFLKVSRRRVILEVTSVSRLMPHGHPPGTTRDILERERACLYVPTRSCHCVFIFTCVHRHVLPRARVHTEECCTSWETSERRRLYDGCVGFDVT